MASISSPSSAASNKEQEEKLRAALDSLPPKDREILSMRAFDGLSFKETADVLGITQNAANVRYWRALEHLKKCFAELRSAEEP